MRTPALLAAALVSAALLAPAPAASAAPLFQLPFPCGQTWAGETRTGHSPKLAVDFNRPGDAGDPVVASAGGTVSTVADRGRTSYGRYVVVAHGGGWSTLYAHLSSVAVRPGQRVAAGARLGAVGNTGGSRGAHLHFEQVRGTTVQRASFDGRSALYFGERSYTSRNACSGPATATGTVTTAGAPLTVRTGPGTGHPAAGSLTDGTRVTITCQATGTAVSGPLGTSRLWDRIGTGRYVSDAYVRTGSDGRVAPPC